MCGQAKSDTIPAPAPETVPGRHQIRNAIRKVARTMKTKTGGTVVYGTMDSWSFVDKVMSVTGWINVRSSDVYSKTLKAVEAAVKASTFFQKEEGVCGSVKLTLRRTADL